MEEMERLEALFSAGVKAVKARRADDAIRLFAKTLAESPDSKETMANLKYVVAAAGLASLPGTAEEKFNAGCRLIAEGRYDDAAVQLVCAVAAAEDEGNDPIKGSAIGNLQFMYSLVSRQASGGRDAFTSALDAFTAHDAQAGLAALDKGLRHFAESLLCEPYLLRVKP